jgi:GTP-binding protein EngB required for normal cell division
MIPAADPVARNETLRHKTLATLRALRERAEAFALPAPPDALELHRRKLEENVFQALVVGEAKRGKSTLVNALIGRDLLPTDTDVATCQVFCVCPAVREAYRLRFEDDSAQAIGAADLASHGSQVLADTPGAPRLDRCLRWIEVEVPARFLPGNLRLLDTPGLGSLYAAHAQITYRFLPHADAVIFVLDSQSPLSEPEVRLIDRILQVTRHLFFVQTKIDQFRREAWRQILDRNQDILRQHFPDRLSGVRVWPLSSMNLRRAALTGDDDYRLVSRHGELARALETFLFQAAGWSRAAEAAWIAQTYQEQGARILAARLAGLTDATPATNTNLIQGRVQWRKQFESDWCERGPQRQTLLQGLCQAATESTRRFRQVLRPACRLEVEARERIDALQSVEQARQLAPQLTEQLTSVILQHWHAAVRRFREQCATLLAPLLGASPLPDECPTETVESLAVRSGRGLDLAPDHFWKTIVAANDFATATGVALTAGCALSFFITASWFPPLAIVGILGIGCWGAVHAWSLATGAQLQAAKEKLHEHVTDILKRAGHHFFTPDPDSTQPSLVEGFFDSQIDALSRHIAQLVSEKLRSADQELQRLEENARLEPVLRSQKAEEVRQQIEVWAGFGQGLQAIQAELRAILPNGPAGQTLAS